MPKSVISRSARLALALLLPALVLAGCASKSDEASPAEKNVTERILFGGSRLPEQKSETQRDYGCPETSILEGTAAYRVGDAGAARGISHQAAIHDLARECRASGNTMNIKVGVRGRLLLGDAGKPGTFTVPVRIAVRSNGNTVYSRLIPTSVVIPAEDTQAPFVVIDDAIALPITAEDPGEAYSIVVGLDPQGARQAPGRKKARAPKRQR
jgi:hypothetical protein